MYGSLRLVVSVLTLVIAAGCELLVPADDGPSPIPQIQVIVGVGADHVVQTEPLVQILPKVGANAAEIAVLFAGIQQGGLGIEGGVLFLSAVDAGGLIVLDRIIDFGGGLQALDPGAYTLIGYYRSCDANCSLLDPAVEFCRVDTVVEAEMRYHLTVTAESCVFEDAAEAS
jgi:hypothetical protein